MAIGLKELNNRLNTIDANALKNTTNVQNYIRNKATNNADLFAGQGRSHYDCGGTCSFSCSSCSGGCTGSATGGCGSTCSANCVSGCSSSCTGCSSSCSGGCSGTCTGNCSGVVVNPAPQTAPARVLVVVQVLTDGGLCDQSQDYSKPSRYGRRLHYNRTGKQLYR